MDRCDAETRLERLVRENRFTIAVVFPLVGAVTLVASELGLLPPPLAFNPAFVLFGTLVMRLPLAAGFLPLVGRREAVALAGLTAYTYLVEYVGVHTGFPYGEFEYLVSLGPMLAGVPVGLPVFFFPLVLNAYLLVLLLLRENTPGWVRVALAVLVVVLGDLVLDPAAVSLGFWQYADGGAYYGVPLSNYLGWILSATVAIGFVEYAFSPRALAERLAHCEFMLDDLVSFVLLWGAVNLVYANWVPAALAALGVVVLVRTERFDFRVRA